MNKPLPQTFREVVGPLSEGGALPEDHLQPFATVAPVCEGFVGADGARVAYAVWGEAGPWLAFATIFQFAHMRALKAAVPTLARRFRVVTVDGLGNGRSDRPTDPAAYRFEQLYRDFVAVLDAVGADRVAVVGISAAAQTAIRFAGEYPDRATHLLICGGLAHMRLDNEKFVAAAERDIARMLENWPRYLDEFMTAAATEPHSSKIFEDGIRHAWATNPQIIEMCRRGWLGTDAREYAPRVRCPTLVIHGDRDQTVPLPLGKAVRKLVPGARMLTIEAGGHLPFARDPACSRAR